MLLSQLHILLIEKRIIWFLFAKRRSGEYQKIPTSVYTTDKRQSF